MRPLRSFVQISTTEAREARQEEFSSRPSCSSCQNLRYLCFFVAEAPVFLTFGPFLTIFAHFSRFLTPKRPKNAPKTEKTRSQSPEVAEQHMGEKLTQSHQATKFDAVTGLMESSIPLLNLRNLGNLWTKPAEPEPSVDKIFSEQKKTKATKYKALEEPAVTAERRTKKLQRIHIHHASTCTPRHHPVHHTRPKRQPTRGNMIRFL